MKAVVLNKQDRIAILYGLRLYEHEIQKHLEENQDPEIVCYYMKKEERIGALRERLKTF